MIHKLKCVQPYFNDIVNGKKKFEVRKDDRGYKVGDRLDLFVGSHEIVENEFGRLHVHVWVTYLMYGGNFGVQSGYVVLGITLTEPNQ